MNEIIRFATNSDQTVGCDALYKNCRYNLPHILPSQLGEGGAEREWQLARAAMSQHPTSFTQPARPQHWLYAAVQNVQKILSISWNFPQHSVIES